MPSPHPEFDRHELLIYEEVARMPPFRRKTLVLIGAQGVGRRSLKNKLILWDPDRYGTTVPCELEVGPAGWRLGPSGVQGWIPKLDAYMPLCSRWV